MSLETTVRGDTAGTVLPQERVDQIYGYQHISPEEAASNAVSAILTEHGDELEDAIRKLTFTA